jgi:tetratricopeptide (TPR) repeat protein
MVAAVNNNNHLAVPQEQALLARGEELFIAGNYNAAWVSFNELTKINPNEYYYYYMRAACSGNQGLYQASLVDLNKALSLAKTNEAKGFCHYDMAIVYANMGDINTAESHLVAAAKFGNGLAQNICKEYGIPY